ncbi:retrotransposon protein, putative, ty1-copia subclass [Tanacetum coccineum]
MKCYLDTLERLGYAMPMELDLSLILNSLNKDYDHFVQNYNMHSMGKSIVELHAMLKLHEKGILKKAETPAVLAIREGKIQKNRKKPQGAKVKDKGKNKLAYAPMPRSQCRLRENIRQRTLSATTTRRWVIGRGIIRLTKLSCGTHICNTSQGLRESRKLKHRALSLYIGNGMRAAYEFGRGVVSISRLVNNGYIHTFTNYGISVSKDNVFYFNAIPRDGIYEIDMHNLYPNVSSMFNVSNKRVKYSLDSSYLWHCRLGHINKKRMDKLQRDGVLQLTHDESLEKCKSCIFRKMARKSFPHQVERAKDLLGLIHTDVCGPFRTVSREGASYFITFTDDFSRYGYVYLMKHKHELTPPYTPQHNRVYERRNQTLLDMVRSMMNLTTLPKSFWGYDLKSIVCILNMVPTKKVERTPYEIWHGKAPKLSYLRETMGYYFYYPLENKIFVARNAEFFENKLMVQEASGSHGPLESRDLDEPPNYKAALLDPESDKWLEAMNMEMKSIKDNQVWVLVELPPNGRTVGSKWIFKKKTDMDGYVHTFKALLVSKGYTQTYDVDYGKTFSPVADIKVIRIPLAIAAFYGYEI